MPPKFKFTKEEIIAAALELTRENGQVKNVRQYDISTLFTLDGIIDMAADAELTDRKAFIKLMLHPDREV